MSSIIEVEYDGNDISNSVVVDSASFEAQLNAVPGTWEFTCKDITRSLSFTTGKEVRLAVDGTNYIGGYLTQISRTHAFDADDTNPVSSYENRYWVLRGVDYNILFDKLVLHNDADHFSQIPNIGAGAAATTYDGDTLTDALTNYIDLPSGFDTSTYVDNTMTLTKYNPGKEWAWPQQGEKLRLVFESLSKFEGQIFYIDADKNFHWHSLERAQSRWGFSDTPNFNAITNATSTYQGSTYGFREVEAVEDGSIIINDALIWGGTALASGTTVFARATDATSVSTHGRWQVAEMHFGEGGGYGVQSGVEARANSIVFGPPGSDAHGQTRGLRYPQWNFKFIWHGDDVPSISGIKQHIRPGQLVQIDMNVFGVSRLLPCRSIRVSFPSNSTDGGSYVRFDGQFGIQITDPFTLWRFLLQNQDKFKPPIIGVVNNDSTATTYGAYYQDEPSPAPDGVETVFTIPFGYIANTTQVFKNGLIQSRGTAYTESDPESGEITFAVAPTGGDELWVIARTLAE